MMGCAHTKVQMLGLGFQGVKIRRQCRTLWQGLGEASESSVRVFLWKGLQYFLAAPRLVLWRGLKSLSLVNIMDEGAERF